MSAHVKNLARPKGNGDVRNHVLTAHAPPLADRVLSAPSPNGNNCSAELLELRQEIKRLGDLLRDVIQEFRGGRKDVELRFNFLLRDNKRKTQSSRAHEVIDRVLKFFRLPDEMLRGKCREQRIVWPRQLCALLLFEERYQHAEIECFFRWPRRTADYAIRRARVRIAAAPRFRNDYENLRKILGEDSGLQPSTKGSTDEESRGDNASAAAGLVAQRIQHPSRPRV